MDPDRQRHFRIQVTSNVIGRLTPARGMLHQPIMLVESDDGFSACTMVTPGIESTGSCCYFVPTGLVCFSATLRTATNHLPEKSTGYVSHVPMQTFIKACSCNQFISRSGYTHIVYNIEDPELRGVYNGPSSIPISVHPKHILSCPLPLTLQ